MLYRVRRSIRYRHFEFLTRQIEDTPPSPCDTDATCEVHTLVCERDLRLYLIAVKSLLRFCPPVSVIVHSDGTLTQTSIDRLRRHIPGCQIVDAADADARAAAALGSTSLLARYRRLDLSCRRLVDSALWTTLGKRIVMDSDVLVLRRPARLIEWMLGAHEPFLFGNSNGACLYGVTCELGLTQIEAHIRALDAGGAMRIPAGDQSLVNGLLAMCGAAPLDPERYVDFHPGSVGAVRNAAIVHFPESYRFHRSVYARLARGVVRNLALSPAPIPQLD